MRLQLPRAAGLCAAVVTAFALVAAPAFADDSNKAEADKPAAAKPESTDAERAAKGGLTEVDIARAFKKYRKQVRDGKTVYCHNEKPLGTRIGKQVCYSEDQVIAIARNERDARDQLKNTNVCGNGSCSPGG